MGNDRFLWNWGPSTIIRCANTNSLPNQAGHRWYPMLPWNFPPSWSQCKLRRKILSWAISFGIRCLDFSLHHSFQIVYKDILNSRIYQLKRPLGLEKCGDLLVNVFIAARVSVLFLLSVLFVRSHHPPGFNVPQNQGPWYTHLLLHTITNCFNSNLFLICSNHGQQIVQSWVIC